MTHKLLQWLLPAAPLLHVLVSVSPAKANCNDRISAPYYGCTRMTLLTERDRFSYYYHTLIYRGRIPEGQKAVTPAMLRNAGQPFWWQVRFPIPAATERSIRLKFWSTVGYNWTTQGWWIAWVPENGYFEINVSSQDAIDQLAQFWNIAPRKYTYASALSHFLYFLTCPILRRYYQHRT